MATTERCINCKSNVGMSASHAVGLWSDDEYLGGVCSNCLTYHERLSTNAQILVELFAPDAIRQ